MAIWVWIIIAILVILLIVVPIVVWLFASSGSRGGTGTACSTDANCATGLVCDSNVCSIPPCPKPGKPTNLSDDQVIDGGNWTVTLTWDDVPNTTFYLVFVGLDDGFDPFSEAVFAGVIDKSEFVFEDVAPSSTAYIRILAVSQDCGTNRSNISDQFTLTTGPIL